MVVVPPRLALAKDPEPTPESISSPSDQSSHVRARAPRHYGPALRRVAEYVKILGLNDPAKIQVFAEECAVASLSSQGEQPENAERHAEWAVREAQQRITAWKEAVFGGMGGQPQSLWLRTFLGDNPQLFMSDPALVRATIDKYGDPLSGQLPQTARFKKQRLHRPSLPNWLRGLLPALLLTAVVVCALWASINGPLSVGGGIWLSLFGLLFCQAALGSWIAARGFFELLRERRSPSWDEHADSDGAPSLRDKLAAVAEPGSALPRSAIIVPIYHENAAQVFANVAAMRSSLRACPGGENFEFFVLSDSQDPACAADEERAFRRITFGSETKIPVYYRRRANNVRQKSGNLAEFFERFGKRYAYVIVLDADSIMAGKTMVELVRRIHKKPRVGLLQAPIVQVGGRTLLSRALQWSTSVAGPLFLRGLSSWAGPHGNYYGHNAVIRTRAFMECCSLPLLAGPPPFGGHLLSHDFVEAALLCRGGWQVRAASDLTHSYEGLPPTLGEYIKRDRRWCQGNLQHLRIVLAPGLVGMSRLHLFIGATAYLAAPTWLAFLLTGIVLTQRGVLDIAHSGAFLAVTAGLLLIPRLLGMAAAITHRDARRQHGGAAGLLSSTVFELVVSSLLAPILLYHHTRIIFSILAGRATRWTSQARHGSAGFLDTVRSELGPTLLGVALSVWLYRWAPQLLSWLAPVWVALVLAIPTSLALSSERWGVFLRRCGLLIVPSEKEPDQILASSEEFLAVTKSDATGRFRDLVLDPVLLEAHIKRITMKATSEPGEILSELCGRALRLGPAGLTQGEQTELMNHAPSLRFLHQEAWCVWPVEAWRIARESPQLPVDSNGGPGCAAVSALGSG